jgi:hypothetical protein
MAVLVSTLQEGVDSLEKIGRCLSKCILGICKKEAVNNNSSNKAAIKAIHDRLLQSLKRKTIKAIKPIKSKNIGSIMNILNMPGIITNIRLLLD